VSEVACGYSAYARRPLLLLLLLLLLLATSAPPRAADAAGDTPRAKLLSWLSVL
jgi:hypothetical protein